jgi:hypothetical protein
MRIATGSLFAAGGAVPEIDAARCYVGKAGEILGTEHGKAQTLSS